MARSYWTCPCGTRNERVKQRCANTDCRRKRPAKRGPKHARVLNGDTYPLFVQVNEELHGAAHGPEWQSDWCGVCGKPPTTARHMDRDHDHLTGLPRGLACPGNRGCNALMPSWLTAERAEAIGRYLRRVEASQALSEAPVALEEASSG